MNLGANILNYQKTKEGEQNNEYLYVLLFNRKLSNSLYMIK